VRETVFGLYLPAGMTDRSDTLTIAWQDIGDTKHRVRFEPLDDPEFSHERIEERFEDGAWRYVGSEYVVALDVDAPE
jgi:hypothetical protein